MRRCNTGLGMYGDDVDRLAALAAGRSKRNMGSSLIAAAAYLLEHQ